MKQPTYDLEERLLEYSVRIIKIVGRLPNTRTIGHVAGQLLRWLKLIQRAPLIKKPELLNDILEETEELIKIFVTSIKTAEKKPV